jgi:uncharacterized protein
MAEAVTGNSAGNGAVPPLFAAPTARLRWGVAGLLLLALLGVAYWLHRTPGYGSAASYSLLTGTAVGILFERGRFCFYCIFRDYIEDKNSEGMFAVLAALAVGGLGYAVVFGAFLPNAAGGRLPAAAHIGPVSWVLLLAGIVFGLGMALSGACISGHLYRLGEGYGRAPFALLGSLIGFGLGFYTWNGLYVSSIARSPTPWLPAWTGYGGALLLHLLVLGLLGWLFLRHLPPLPARQAVVVTPRYLLHLLFGRRWNPLLTGGLVGLVGVLAYFRVEPLGVTAQLGSLSRTALHGTGLLPERLNGLDTLAGCATQVVQTVMDNGWLISGLVLGSLAMALLANRFKVSGVTAVNGSTALLGGILMGWGSMTALGCTVGTLLSGISAFALSGWLFGLALFGGVWLGIRLGLHRIGI